jgi:hypothetical protein
MRVLSGGDRRRPLAAAVTLAGGLVAITLAIVVALVDAVL